MKRPTISGFAISYYRDNGHEVTVNERKRIAIIDGQRFRIEGAIPRPCLSNVPRSADKRTCELCGANYAGASTLKGLCGDCCAGLEGGRIAAKGMQEEIGRRA